MNKMLHAELQIASYIIHLRIVFFSLKKLTVLTVILHNMNGALKLLNTDIYENVSQIYLLGG